MFVGFSLYLLFSTNEHLLLLFATLFESLLHPINGLRLTSEPFIAYIWQALDIIEGPKLLVETQWLNSSCSGSSRRKFDVNFLGRKWFLLLFLLFVSSDTVWSHHCPVKYKANKHPNMTLFGLYDAFKIKEVCFVMGGALITLLYIILLWISSLSPLSYRIRLFFYTFFFTVNKSYEKTKKKCVSPSFYTFWFIYHVCGTDPGS